MSQEVDPGSFLQGLATDEAEQEFISGLMNLDADVRSLFDAVVVLAELKKAREFHEILHTETEALKADIRSQTSLTSTWVLGRLAGAIAPLSLACVGRTAKLVHSEPSS